MPPPPPPPPKKKYHIFIMAVLVANVHVSVFLPDSVITTFLKEANSFIFPGLAVKDSFRCRNEWHQRAFDDIIFRKLISSQAMKGINNFCLGPLRSRNSLKTLIDFSLVVLQRQYITVLQIQ